MIFFFWIARYVTPAEVGLFSLALAVNLILYVMLDEPATEALVQRQFIDETHWSTAFWTNLALACTVVTILACAGPLVAEFLGHPNMRMLFPTLALSSLFGALGNIHRAYIIRKQHFRVNAIVALTAQLAGGVLTVPMAMYGFGVWALAFNVVFSAALASCFYWFASGWRPRMIWSREAASDLIHVARHVMTLRSVTLLRDQGTFLLVGVMAGSVMLGYFNFAFRIVRSIGQLLEDVLNRVGLSVVSRAQADAATFSAVTTRIFAITALVGLPCLAGLFLVGPDALVVLFGSQWQPSGPIVRLLCVLTALQLVQHAFGIPLRSLGYQRVIVRLTAPFAILDLIVVAIFARHAIETMLYVLVVRNLLVLPAYAVLLRRYTPIAVLQLFHAAVLPAGATAIMATMVGLVATHSEFQPALKLAAMIGTGVVAYSIAVLSGIQVRRMAGWTWIP